jgi:hypothetical protein
MNTDTESGVQPHKVPVATPLDWPVVNAGGMPLFDRGAILARPEDRDFLSGSTSRTGNTLLGYSLALTDTSGRGLPG